MSPMMREYHVGICEGRAVKFPGASSAQADIQPPEIEVCFAPKSGRGNSGSRESVVDPTRILDPNVDEPLQEFASKKKAPMPNAFA